MAERAPDGGWARLYGGTRSVRLQGSDGSPPQRARSFEAGGANHDRQISGMQMGQDLYGRRVADDAAVRAGVSLGVTHAQADVGGLYAGDGQVGTVRMDGYSLGGYWTYAQQAGWYVDVHQMFSLYRHVRIDGGALGGMGTRGWGSTTSIEVGRNQRLGGGWFIEPQAQLIHQFTRLGDAHHGQSLQVHYAHGQALHARWGARFGKTLEGAHKATLYAHADLWHTGGGHARTTYDVPSRARETGLQLATRLGGTWLQTGVGMQGALTRNLTVHGALDYQQALQGDGGHGVAGHAGLRLVW